MTKKKRTCRTVDFAVPADNRMKIKSEKIDNYLDLIRKLRKLWNMRVSLIPIVIGGLRTVAKVMEKGTGRVGNRRTKRDHTN